MNTNTLKVTRLGALLAVAVLALSGCSAGAPSPSDEAAPAGEVTTIADAWVKSADEGMTAAFGELRNTGSDDVTVVSVQTEASSMLELHETVENDAGQMVMREREGGFLIPAGGLLTLEPGGNHIMLIDLTGPLLAGEEVTFTLTFSDRSTLVFAAVVKDFAGGNETYEHGDDHGDHGSDEGH